MSKQGDVYCPTSDDEYSKDFDGLGKDMLSGLDVAPCLEIGLRMTKNHRKVKKSQQKSPHYSNSSPSS